MFKENTIAGADGGSAVAPRIPRETHARRGVKEMSFHATCGRATNTAADKTQIADNTGVQLKRNGVKGHHISTKEKIAIHRVNGEFPGIESRRIPVPGVAVLFPVSTEQAHAQAEIQGKSGLDSPIVLDVGFRNLKALVVSALCRVLREALNKAFRRAVGVCVGLNQKISERVSGAVGEIAVSQ